MVKTYKLLIIGEGGCGKTSIANRYTTGAFKESHLMTLGANFMLKDLKLDNGETVRLSIWDTAGQERFRKMVETYYKGAVGCIITYDITNLESFKEVEYWKTSATNKAPNAKLTLVGNKLDLEENRSITTEEGKMKADEWGVSFFETSAKFNQNINEIFYDLINKILNT